MNYFILLPIVAAFLLGASIPFQNFDSDEKINKYATISTFLVSIVFIKWGKSYTFLL